MASAPKEQLEFKPDSVWNDDVVWGDGVKPKHDTLQDLPGFVEILPPLKAVQPERDNKDWA